MTSYLLHVPRDQRHKLIQIVEAVLRPKFQATNTITDTTQTVLRSKVIQYILPARIVVEFRSGHRLVVDREVAPDARHVKGVIPVSTNLLRFGRKINI